MDLSSATPDFNAFLIREIGALLFGTVFLFLWRQSRVVYFGLWAAAWLLRCIAGVFGYQLLRTQHPAWLAPHAIFEFAVVIVLIAAARAGFASSVRDWRTVLRLISILPVFVALAWALGRFTGIEAYHASQALALSLVYAYNLVALRRNSGLGARVFRVSLLLLSVAFLIRAAFFLHLHTAGGAPDWARYLSHEAYYVFALHCVLTFAAMAMWSESQIDRVKDLTAELDRLRRESAQSFDLDRLTGLLNQSALARRMEVSGGFDGVVVVCDMDNFKDINDSYGHLVGDEILRNIGNLLHASIRKEDEAFRWGGDEFVILFHQQNSQVARKRMEEIEGRLQEFRVRGLGALPISFSWGTADGHTRALREAMDEADRNMYTLKRARAAAPGERRNKA